MFLQDNDSHPLHPNPSDVYIFLVLAAILDGGTKLMNYLDNRKESKQQTGEKDSRLESEKRSGLD